MFTEDDKTPSGQIYIVKILVSKLVLCYLNHSFIRYFSEQNNVFSTVWEKMCQYIFMEH